MFYYIVFLLSDNSISPSIPTEPFKGPWKEPILLVTCPFIAAFARLAARDASASSTVAASTAGVGVYSRISAALSFRARCDLLADPRSPAAKKSRRSSGILLLVEPASIIVALKAGGPLALVKLVGSMMGAGVSLKPLQTSAGLPANISTHKALISSRPRQ